MPIAGFVRVRARIQHKHARLAHNTMPLRQKPMMPCGCRINIMLNAALSVSMYGRDRKVRSVVSRHPHGKDYRICWGSFSKPCSISPCWPALHDWRILAASCVHRARSFSALIREALASPPYACRSAAKRRATLDVLCCTVSLCPCRGLSPLVPRLRRHARFVADMPTQCP